MIKLFSQERPNIGDRVLVKSRFVNCWIEATYEGKEWRNSAINFLVMVSKKDLWCALPLGCQRLPCPWEMLFT